MNRGLRYYFTFAWKRVRTIETDSVCQNGRMNVKGQKKSAGFQTSSSEQVMELLIL